MSKNSNSGLKIEWLYALLGITVFIMGVFYAASLKNELGFWHNFFNYTCIPFCIALFSLWKYVFLLFPNEYRPSAWVFPIFELAVVFFWTVVAILADSSSHSWWSQTTYFEYLLYLFYPLLISSCITCYKLASTFIGKVIFISAILLFLIIDILYIIASKDLRFLLIGLLFLLMFLIIYFPARQAKPISDGGAFSNETNN